ncbi:hypothetical protein ISN76_19125 [Dyella halodurans]|uniref:Uncharacterized protein n=1 Tax=Dyella halodurans TaxID=1920171 RepID=A0ABV9C092_9GAMM|nr:hypothetical protein [Dyella halodurans]
MSEFPAPFMQKKRLALKGRFYLRPLLWSAGVFLVLSYLSLLAYPRFSSGPAINGFVDAAASLIPVVRNAPEYSRFGATARFIMSVQWLFVPIYAWVLFVGYCPFSTPTRIAIHGWYKRTYVSHRELKLFVGGITLCLYLLGEIGVMKFPTLMNGGFFPLDEGKASSRTFVGIMNSSIAMPLFAWFAPFATICVYWAILHYVVNFRMIFTTAPRPVAVG